MKTLTFDSLIDLHKNRILTYFDIDADSLVFGFILENKEKIRFFYNINKERTLIEC